MIFKDTSRLTTILVNLTYIQIAVSIMAIGSGYLEIQLMKDIIAGAASEPGFTETANANDTRQMVIGILQFVVFMLSLVLFLRFVYLSNRNASILAKRKLRFSLGWSVGWFFIPIASIWKPYQVVSEIWNVSCEASELSEKYNRNNTGKWWGFFLAAMFISQGATRMIWRAETAEEYISADIAYMISDMIEIPLGLLLIGLIRTINRFQRTPWAPSSIGRHN